MADTKLSFDPRYMKLKYSTTLIKLRGEREEEGGRKREREREKENTKLGGVKWGGSWRNLEETNHDQNIRMN